MRFLFVLLACVTSFHTYAQSLPLELLKLPPGFNIAIYAYPVPSARELTLGSNNIVFAGSREGAVYAIVPDDHSQYGTKVITIAHGLNEPNGVAFWQGNLYVAEIGRLLRFDDIENHLDHPPKPVIVTDKLPKESHHGMRFIRFGKDGKLYMGIGMPCNICLKEDPRFGTIVRMNPDGGQFEIYAKGVRNSMGFDWGPHTQKLWFTDNGRDWLGDDAPPDELNYAPQPGMDFGFPYYNGHTIDPDYGKFRKNKANSYTPPSYELPAHVAALGMSFYTGAMFPPPYQGQIFIAEHGSWNRSKKIGYQVVVTDLSGTQVKSVSPFITGWLVCPGRANARCGVWGRPVDVIVMPDGALLVSDDYAGVIYRVSYQK